MLNLPGEIAWKGFSDGIGLIRHQRAKETYISRQSIVVKIPLRSQAYAQQFMYLLETVRNLIG